MEEGQEQHSKHGARYFDEGTIHPDADPVHARTHADFDWATLSELLGEPREPTGDESLQAMAMALRGLLYWLTAGNSAAVIGYRCAMMALVLGHPELVDSKLRERFRKARYRDRKKRKAAAAIRPAPPASLNQFKNEAAP